MLSYKLAAVNGLHGVRVITGVNQGPILGLMLFLVHVNNLLEGQESNLNKVVDDTKIIRESIRFQDSENLRRDLDRLQLWSNTLLMMFNSTKSKMKTE